MNSVVQRLDAVETTIKGHAEMMKTIHSDSKAARDLAQQALDSQASIKDGVDELLSIVSYSKSGTAFLRKNGGRIVTAVIGYLVLSGKLTGEMGDLVKHLFGI